MSPYVHFYRRCCLGALYSLVAFQDCSTWRYQPDAPLHLLFRTAERLFAVDNLVKSEGAEFVRFPCFGEFCARNASCKKINESMDHRTD